MYKNVSRKRPNKFRPKKGMRKRFAKKTFVKNNNFSAALKSTALPRELFVKLKWSRITSETLPASSSFAIGYNATSVFPLSTTSGIPGVGATIVSQIPEYSLFYDNYTPLGASIKVFIINNRTTQMFYRCVLVPISTAIGGDMSSHITALASYDYNSLSSIQNAQTRVLGLGTGGNSACSFKMFRKTKDMLSIKDMRDQYEMKLDLPTSTTGGTLQINEGLSWFYYLRVFNSSGTASEVDLEVKMTYYYQLSNRKTITQVVTTA